MSSDHFRGSGVEKLARMSRSKCTQQTTFGISNRGFQTTFWKIICRKKPMWQERHFEVKCQNIKVRTTFRGSHPEKICYCGRKHIGKLKCQRVSVFQTLLKDHMPKKYTSLWQGNIFQVKPLFETRTVHAVAKNRFPNKISKTNHFWKITCQQSLWQEPYFHVNISKT